MSRPPTDDGGCIVPNIKDTDLYQTSTARAIERIPTEVLKQIIHYAVASRGIRSRATSLELVNQHWRHTILNYSILWSYIYVSSHTSDASVKIYLERSGNAPLSVHFRAPPHLKRVHGSQLKTSALAVDLLFAQVERWRFVEIAKDAGSTILNRLSVTTSPLPNLRHLETSWVTRVVRGPWQITPFNPLDPNNGAYPFTQTKHIEWSKLWPNLESLFFEEPLRFNQTLNMVVPSVKMLRLCLTSDSPSDLLAQVSKQAPSLEELRLAIPVLTHPSPASVPRMSNLRTVHTYGNLIATSTVLSLLVAAAAPLWNHLFISTPLVAFKSPRFHMLSPTVPNITSLSLRITDVPDSYTDDSYKEAIAKWIGKMRQLEQVEIIVPKPYLNATNILPSFPVLSPSDSSIRRRLKFQVMQVDGGELLHWAQCNDGAALSLNRKPRTLVLLRKCSISHASALDEIHKFVELVTVDCTLVP